MTDSDVVMQPIGDGIGASQRGDRPRAREIFAAVWADVGEDGDPLHRCAVAHAMADVQDDPHEELEWDQRALDAARVVTDERAATAGMAGTARALLPSLHLNLADVHHRLGDLTAARHHVDLGLAALHELPDDGYREMVAGGLTRLDVALGRPG